MEGPQDTETPRREAVASAPAALSQALDALGAGAYVVDERGCILAVNAQAERMLGRSADELVGQDAHDLLHRGPHGQPLPHSQCAMRHAFHAGRPAQGAGEYFALPDGSVRPIGWMITPYAAGGDEERTLVLFHPQEIVEEPASPPETPTAPLTELERLALLAEATAQLTSTLDTDETLRRLGHLVVPRLADWVVVDLITERDEVWRDVVAHADGATLKRHEDLEGPMPPVLAESQWPLSRALRGASSTVTGPERYHREPDSGIAVEQRRLFDRTGMHSAAIAPIRGTREVLGALTLGRAEDPVAFTPADLPLVEDIARRAGLALDNARLYQRQRKVAETMQNHLLPQMPGVPGLEMTARYLPAPDASQVGGDWYDAFPLSDGATALAIGDVVGHDLEAASGMAQLRNMLRAYAWSQNEPPSRIVTRLDEAMEHITDVSMATMIFARIEALEDGTWRLSWTNAGHPPMLLIARDGVARFLEEGHGVALGTGLRARRPDAQIVLEPGSTLVLYTDGLVEEHGQILDVGLDRLRRHAAAYVHRPLTVLADQVLRRVRPADNDDDVALLALRAPA
ncbi:MULTISPECIES: SpoIIE family protein phosphatase [unclassified Streptomyces]|uniref:SpoIIE family protein phosphatase n=1 Tax=unclassified Streptomyces TaxID=2593676 RepID=UPI00074A4C53|nr:MULTISPECIES: SpoIIE family protein phosphatase [unclassified Streptomyces]KUL69070.1 DNA-binding protein [Streptomyces sp. NRRL WC-3605]KUL80206.1 DNA-binding protein [Streptomyces sp. NRRL WC-3604]